MSGIESEIVRYGGQGLLPVKEKLRAGALTAELLEDGTLRYIKAGNEEIIRSLYPTFRDENWSTVPARFTSFEMKKSESSFVIEFAAEHRNDSIHYEWQGKIDGSEDGVLRYSMKGEARNDFLKNRVGFCVLHPMEVAGSPLQVEVAGGKLIEDQFAELITPHDPFTDMKSMQFKMKSGLDVKLIFAGDLFHTEDQRNWTDASYKTFCTPLQIPYPVQMKKGDRLEQSVTLAIAGEQTQSTSDEQGLKLEVMNEPGGKLPKLGTWNPDLGRPLYEKERALLGTCGLSVLRASINILGQDWKTKLESAAETAQALQLEFELEVLSDGDEPTIRSLISFIKSSGIHIDRLSLYPVDGFDSREPVPVKCDLFGASYQAVQYATKESLLLSANKYLQEANLSIPVGGGSRTNFTEFNRAVLPLEHMDFAEYAVNPQVHTFDIASIVETLEAQALTVETAKSIIDKHNIPLHINSVTLKQRLNPYAANEEGVKKSQTIAEQYDPRLSSLFGAGWTIGSIRQLSRHGVKSINYYEAAGKLGMMDEGGIALYPVYQLFAELADFKDAELLQVNISDSYKMEALALRSGARFKLFIANLTNEQQDVEVEVPPLAKVNLRMMAETSIGSMAPGRAAFVQVEFAAASKVSLLPFGIACLEAEFV